MTANLLRLLLCALPFSSASADCGAPFLKVEGVCTSASKDSFESYCKAQAFCANIGGELITGENMRRLSGQNLFGELPWRFWIGLTDLAAERGKNHSGWRWTNGSLAPPSDQLTWGEETEWKAHFDCAFSGTRNYAVHLTSCSKVLKPWFRALCQPRETFAWNNRQINFRKEPLLEADSDVDFAQFDCVKRYPGSRSEHDCVRRCALLGRTEWCAAFFFNARLELCLLVLYTDANLKVTGGGWVKFSVIWK